MFDILFLLCIANISLSVKPMDNKVIQDAMSKIEDKTCIKFKYVPEHEAPIHHLEISIQTQTEDCKSNAGGVKSVDGSAGKVKMYFKYSLRCQDSSVHVNLVLHEFGHVLGLAHTHRRPDRDEKNHNFPFLNGLKRNVVVYLTSVTL